METGEGGEEVTTVLTFSNFAQFLESSTQLVDVSLISSQTLGCGGEDKEERRKRGGGEEERWGRGI